MMRYRNNSELRIFLIGNRGYATKILLKLIECGENVIGICSRATPSYGMELIKKLVRRFLIFAGIYKKDVFEYSHPFVSYEFPAKIATAKKIPVFDPQKLESLEFEQGLRELNPDIILMAGFHKRIPKNIINIPKIAAINFHPSLLPKHRGGSPSRWVIRNGDKISGVTAHIVDETFDTGPIVLSEKIIIDKYETWGSLEHKCADKMVAMLEDLLHMAAENRLNPKAQDKAEATYERSLKAKDQIIDWSLSADEIMRICYARKPKSGGITSFEKKKFSIWNLKISTKSDFCAAPGTIVGFSAENYPIVAAVDGTITIKEILYSGKIRHAGKVAKALGFRKGARFI